MRTLYRGHLIQVHRARALGGWSNLYFTVTRESDGLVLVDSFTTGADAVKDFLGYMKERVDEAVDSYGPNYDIDDAGAPIAASGAAEARDTERRQT